MPRSKPWRSPHRWPVSLRPQSGELLYSWVSRIAAVYQLTPAELLAPEEGPFAVDGLIQHASDNVLQRLRQGTGLSLRALSRMTLAGARSLNQPAWWISAVPVSGSTASSPAELSRFTLQICPVCLRDDFRKGIAFVRLLWQSAVMTICPQHHGPLRMACVAGGPHRLPLCHYHSDGRFSFDSPQRTGMTLPGEEDWEDRPPAPALRMLLAFERLLVERALPGRSVDPWWVGSNDPIPLLRLVDDLAGALLCSYRDTRPLYHLQIPFFPVTPHRIPETARTRWCFASPEIRRALFAVVLTLTGPEEVRAAFTGLKRGPRFPELLKLLSYRDGVELQRRSQGWPPSVRDRLRRAFRSPRLRHRLGQQRLAVPELRNSTRSDWPILTI